MDLTRLRFSIRARLLDEVEAYRKTRGALDRDFPLNKKLQLVDALKKGVNPSEELMGIIERQLAHLPGYFRWWRKKVLKIDIQLKEAILLEEEIIKGKVELDKAALGELSRRVRSIPDQEVIAVYRDLFQATLEEERIAGEDFTETDAATALKTKELRYVDDFMRNLSKQRALLVEIKSQVGKGLDPRISYDGKNTLGRLSTLIEEEERFHTMLIRDESIWLASKRKLIDHYAGPWMWEVRQRRAKLKLAKYFAIGMLSAGVALAIMNKIEGYMPAKPGHTVTEISREIEALSERMGKGNLADVVRTEAGQIGVKMNEKIAAEKIGDINKAVDAAIVLMADRIYDIHIRQLAELLKQHEAVVRVGYDIGYFKKNKDEIRNAIQKTINRQYRPLIIRLVEDEVSKHASIPQKFSNWMDMGGGRSDLGRGLERETMNTILQKLEPMIAELLDEAIKRTTALIKSAAEEATKKAAEGVAPELVREYVRPAIDLFIVNWYWLGIGGIGLVGFGAMVFSRREKNALRTMYEGGFMHATEHLRNRKNPS